MIEVSKTNITNMNKKVSFVVLHYQDANMTIKCIESILALKYSESIAVVVVDNASPNESGKVIRKQYVDEKRVGVLINSKNMGFAKGNNIGYKYAKQILGANIIVILNNDIVFEDGDFIFKILEHHSRENVHLYIPNVVSVDGIHGNPARTNPRSTVNIFVSWIYLLMNNLFNKIPILGILPHKIRGIKMSLMRFEESDAWKHSAFNVMPHGSCIIYGELGVSREDFAFIKDTFMYCEEELLYDYVIANQYRTLYLLDVPVRHYERVSTSYKKRIEERLISFIFAMLPNPCTYY